MANNEADIYDMECMSPLYATPPHSPSSELSSPGQLPSINNIDECAGSGAASLNGGGHGASSSSGGKSILADNHFARDTHMRIILGNLKENQASSSRLVRIIHSNLNIISNVVLYFSKNKRSGITTNPAMRLIRSRFDSAAQLIRRTNNILSSNSQGSSSIGVKSGTFQWRKESQM